jgi:hypothetical protein
MIRWLIDFRFAVHYGLNSDNELRRKSANWRHPSVTSSVGRDAVCRILFWLDAVPHVAARDPHQ